MPKAENGLKECSRCNLIKLVSEYGVRSKTSDGLRNECKSCTKLEREKYTEEHPEKKKVNSKRWADKNKEKIAIYQKKYGLENKDKINIRIKKWRKESTKEKEWVLNNKDKVKAAKKKYRQNNRAKINAHTAKRRAMKLQATVTWADYKEIEKIYSLARKKSEETGIRYVVDHIFPLTSDLVCGLHWEGNLQVLTSTENEVKYNKF